MRTRRFVDNAVVAGPAAKERHKDDVAAALSLLAQGTDHLPITQVDAVSDEVGAKLQSIGFTQFPEGPKFNPYTTGRR